MIVITLVCNLGMSASMLVDNISEVAKAKGTEIDIEAMAFDKADRRLEKTDILLIAPQIKHHLPRFKENYGDKIPVITAIDFRDFGLVNGEKVLKDSIAAYEAVKK